MPSPSITTKSSLLTETRLKPAPITSLVLLHASSENVVVLKNMPDVAAQSLEHWQDRWNKGTDWRP